LRRTGMTKQEGRRKAQAIDYFAPVTPSEIHPDFVPTLVAGTVTFYNPDSNETETDFNNTTESGNDEDSPLFPTTLVVVGAVDKNSAAEAASSIPSDMPSVVPSDMPSSAPQQSNVVGSDMPSVVPSGVPSAAPRLQSRPLLLNQFTVVVAEP